jgi:hypothetical protein
MLQIRNAVESVLKETIGFKADGMGVQVVNPPEADLSGLVHGKRVRVRIVTEGLEYS